METPLEKQWPFIQSGIKDPECEFDLKEEVIEQVVRSFNIKIQKCSSGYLCFPGHKVGLATNGKTSGRAFCNFLRREGFSWRSTYQEACDRYLE